MINETKKLIEQQIAAERNPRKDYLDVILAETEPVPVAELGQDYGFPEAGMVMLLASRCERTGITAEKLINAGLVVYVPNDLTYKDPDDRLEAAVRLKWTQKGRLWVYRSLEKCGILPNVDKEFES